MELAEHAETRSLFWSLIWLAEQAISAHGQCHKRCISEGVGRYHALALISDIAAKAMIKHPMSIG